MHLGGDMCSMQLEQGDRTRGRHYDRRHCEKPDLPFRWTKKNPERAKDLFCLGFFDGRRLKFLLFFAWNTVPTFMTPSLRLREPALFLWSEALRPQTGTPRSPVVAICHDCHACNSNREEFDTKRDNTSQIISSYLK